MSAIGLDLRSLTQLRSSFLGILLVQVSIPLWPTFWQYVYPPDYLTKSGPCTSSFFGICTKSVPSACSGGPKDALPEYDFVIVGAGPAGSLLAYRLGMKYPNKYILLIESGQAPPIDVMPPTYFPFLQKIPSAYDYAAESKFLRIVDGAGSSCSRTEGSSSIYGLGYKNGLPCDAGKGLGGGTIMNAMLWVCGTYEDYEGWKTSTGDSNWGWNSMLLSYKNVMKQGDTSIPQCAYYYGQNGPLTVTDPKASHPTIDLFKSAAREIGYPILPDINCGRWIGLANVHQTIANGERNHAARAFLSRLYMNRPNVMVMRGATVDKILLKRETSGAVTASGVRVVTSNSDCESFDISAKNEIILTAGSLNTPLILQRSGIGRTCDLNPFSIPQLIDSPVGANYQDHPFDLIFFTSDPSQEEIEAANNQISILAGQATAYYLYRSGPVSYLGSLNWNFFINTNDNPINPNSNPNIQYICYQFDLKQPEFDTILKEKFGIKDIYADQLLDVNQSKKLLMCYNILLNPKSRGLVRIRSTDPMDPPRIHSNYVTNPQDVATANKGINKLFQIIETEAFQNVSAAHFKINIQECDSLTYKSAAYWNCYRKYFGQNLWHPAGTCKMGSASDASAVVDTKLQVKGISGSVKVRVGDASIMPKITSGNTQCPVYAIAENLANIITELYV